MNDNEINEKNFFLVYEYLYQIESFTLNDIIIYSIIKGLNSNGKKCYATNSYFAKRIKKNNDTVRKSITKLFENGYIEYTKDFKHQSNRVLTVTNKIDAYLKTKEGLLKNKRGVTKKHNSTLVKTSNNNIDHNIIINTSTTTEKLKSNLELIESICKEKNIDKEFLNKQIEIFSKHIEETKKRHKDNNDLYSHFKYWLDKYKPKEEINLEKYEKNYLWFLDVFNKISNRTFLPSDITRKLFAKQFENGFTGEHFRNAISNLYSSDVGNKFHIDSSFKNATPQYLLKDENVNKYLNVSWSNNKIKKAVRIG